MSHTSSFEVFVQLHRARLMRAAQRIVPDPAEAEDVVQDTLLAVWRVWQRRPPDDAAAYAFRAIAFNSVKRRLRRRRTCPIDAAKDVAAALAPSSLDPLELERAIAQLPIAQQTVLRMRFYLGLSLAQIGRNLSISADTAASRCRYGLAKLRKSLNSDDSQTSPERKLAHGQQTHAPR